MPVTRSSLKRRAGLATALLLPGALLPACKPRPALAPPPPAAFDQQGGRFVVPAASPLRRKLVLAAPEDAEVASDTVSPGAVELDPARQDRVLPPVAGRLVSLDVRLGQPVRKGQVLARMTSPDLAQAVDDDAHARSQLALTKAVEARAVAALGIGGGSQKDVQQAQADHAQAEAEATRTAARLRQLGADDRAHGGVLSIVSPRAGVVTDLAAASGAYWNDLTAPLMTVADMATIWVAADVAEDELPSAHPGQRAEVRFDALPGQSFEGRVLFVAAQLDPDTRRAKVRIALANPKAVLKPNMFATVRLMATARRQMTVPTTALLFSDSQSHVFVEVAPWTFERRVVQTGIERGGRTAVTGDLRPNERVVIHGGVLLDD